MQFRLEDFSLYHILGEGTYGQVFLAYGPKKQKVALKRYKKIPITLNYFTREKMAGQIERHSGIVQLLGDFQTSNHFYLMYDYFDGFDLITLLQRNNYSLKEEIVKKIFHGLIEAVAHCHKNRLAHRDLKLDNVLVNESHKVALIDFGFCAIQNSPSERHQDSQGSVEYAAPELLCRIPYSSFKTDSYSSGVILYCLLFGEFPFILQELEEELNYSRLPPLRFPKKISESAQDLIIQLLKMDPDTRISIEDSLQHPWLNSKNSSNSVQNNIDTTSAEVSNSHPIESCHSVGLSETLSLMTSAC